jgi:hypothetical protein
MKMKTKLFIISMVFILLFSKLICALPTVPSISYVSNTTATSLNSNRSVDVKGTITTLRLSAVQQDYKWKAYVGNATGKLALDDSTGKTIYDWTMGTITGEIYVTRASSVTWGSIGCANDTTVNTEQSMIGMSQSQVDSINRTFATYSHRSITIGPTLTISNSTCKSIATYINDSAQVVNETAHFQELLLHDNTTGSLVYTTFIENQHQGFDNINYDFQLLVAENESSTIPFTYFFYVEIDS